MVALKRYRTALVVFGVVGAIVVTGVIAAATVLSPDYAEWRDAIDAYEEAVALNDDAREALVGAAADAHRVNASFVAGAELVEFARGLEGVIVPSSAVSSLVESLEGWSIEPFTPVEVASPTRVADPGSLSAPELMEATRRVAVDTLRVQDATRACADFIDAAEASLSGFNVGLSDFTTALLAKGEDLLAGRTDAAADALAALRSATDAVAGGAGDSLIASVRAWGTAALEVVRTSNANRIDDPNSVVVVVNKRRPLQPQDYAPSLVHVNVRHLWSPLLRAEAADPLVSMFAAFESETGLQLRLQNSYRSYATQVDTYGYHVATKGQAQADRGSARPGHSEHQTGLALDVDGVGYGCSIQQCFGDLVHGQWLETNAWRFGWVVRYPKGYEHITGYDWEPWHLRYVGVDVSTAMHRQGILTLEEYFGLEPAPTYP